MPTRAALALSMALVAAALSGCKGESPTITTAPGGGDASEGESSGESSGEAAKPDPEALTELAAPKAGGDSESESRPWLAVLDADVLATLEAAGHTLGERLGGESPASTTAALSGLDAWSRMASVIEDDIDKIKASDPKAGVGMRFGHRLFDPTWLDDDEVRFELVGVVVRLDRGAETRCGELRHVYRMAYTTDTSGLTVDSRLPMTVNSVVEIPRNADESCQKEAQRWVQPESGGALGALQDGRLDGATVRVEMNLQVVRWPSKVHPNMAGHAEYIMRVFDVSGARPQAIGLENTPDAARLRGSKALRGELVEWLRQPETLAAIDRGDHQVPEKFLAKRGVSVAPRGLARLANRPFRSAVDESDLDGVQLAGYEHFSTPVSLLRRLDGLTCMGCHHSRSVAGFQLLGHERLEIELDALAVATSPHFDEEMPWRERHASDLAAGGDGYAAAGGRPSPERGDGPGGFGVHCGLGDPGFADWTCAEGYTCRPLEDLEVGRCSPTGEMTGAACESGTMKTKADPRRDRVRDLVETGCGTGYCETNDVGFPAGMCADACGESDHSVCGGIPGLTDFNSCLARKRPFRECIAETVHPAALRACDAETPCRDDYVCARVPGEERGGCLPPYFLFQLRVDGHPL